MIGANLGWLIQVENRPFTKIHGEVLIKMIQNKIILRNVCVVTK